MWFRVFGSSDLEPKPAQILDFLRSLNLVPRGHFRGDDGGWFEGEVVFGSDGPRLPLQRYLAEEPDIRRELNSWAAWLETNESNASHGTLMRQVIQTRQLFTIELVEDALGLGEICSNLCGFLAGATDGVYQADERGFFAADGTLLIAEN